MSIQSMVRTLPMGSVQPRLWTPPLRDLNEPGASVGPLQAEFAREVLRVPFDPWQEWLALHAGELLSDGRPRFWLVLVLVSRQNGKTHIPATLSPYWSLIDQVPMTLGTSTKLQYAKESFMHAVRMMERAARRPGDPLYGIIPGRRSQWVRQANGETGWYLGDPVDPVQYLIAPANAEGGRSLTVGRLVMDELRQHRGRSAWNAAVPATEVVEDSQVWALSNAGDDFSTVLNSERASALQTIETGDGDQGVGIFEWSAPEDADPTDPEALAMANPQFGYRMNGKRLLAKARTAVELGGETLTGFKTESMCTRVKIINPAIDPGSWARCLSPGPLERSRIAMVIDASRDGGHVTCYAAASLPDGRVRVDPVEAWEGRGCVDAAEQQILDVIDRVRPRVLGWYPYGPAAAMAARLRKRKGVRGWPPRGVRVEEISAEVPAVCMGFEKMITGGMILHSGDPLLDDHVSHAVPKRHGDTWTFDRATGGHVDALYAAAGAVHLARIMPRAAGKPRVVVAST